MPAFGLPVAGTCCCSRLPVSAFFIPFACSNALSDYNIRFGHNRPTLSTTTFSTPAANDLGSACSNQAPRRRGCVLRAQAGGAVGGARRDGQDIWAQGSGRSERDRRAGRDRSDVDCFTRDTTAVEWDRQCATHTRELHTREADVSSVRRYRHTLGWQGDWRDRTQLHQVLARTCRGPWLVLWE